LAGPLFLAKSELKLTASRPPGDLRPAEYHIQDKEDRPAGPGVRRRLDRRQPTRPEEPEPGPGKPA